MITKTEEVQGIVSGSFIMALLYYLSKEDLHKASVTRLRQALGAKLKDGHRDLIEVATDAYNYVKDELKDEEIELDLGIVIEAIAGNKSESMKKVFGSEIETMVDRAAAKITLPNLTKKQGRDSWDVASKMKSSIEKHTYHYLKGE